MLQNKKNKTAPVGSLHQMNIHPGATIKKKTNIIKIKDDLKDYKNQTKVQLQLKNCG